MLRSTATVCTVTPRLQRVCASGPDVASPTCVRFFRRDLWRGATTVVPRPGRGPPPPCNSVFVLVLPDSALRCEVRSVHTHGWRGTFAWRHILLNCHSDLASPIRGATVVVSPHCTATCSCWCCWSLRPLTRAASAHSWSAADSRVTLSSLSDSAYINHAGNVEFITRNASVMRRLIR